MKKKETACTFLLSAARNQVFNSGSELAWSQLDYLRALREVVQWQGDVVLEGVAEPPANYQQDLLLDTSKIRALLGYKEAYAPEEGLAETVAYERQRLKQS